MLPDRVSNPGPLTYESGAVPIALRSPAPVLVNEMLYFQTYSMVTLPFLEKKKCERICSAKAPHKVMFSAKNNSTLITAVFYGGAPVAQWVKHWPTDLADRVWSQFEAKSSQP